MLLLRCYRVNAYLLALMLCSYLFIKGASNASIFYSSQKQRLSCQYYPCSGRVAAGCVALLVVDGFEWIWVLKKPDDVESEASYIDLHICSVIGCLIG